MTFIQPKDPFIAALMFELGNVTFDLGHILDALSIYKKAKKYGFEDSLIITRIQQGQIIMSDLQKCLVATDTIIHDYSAETIPAATIPNDSVATTPTATSAPMGPMPGSPWMLIVIVGGLTVAVSALIYFLKRAAR
ncbi:MAG: hypothetical protein IPN95_16555 [Bacteroidetes bacterium]|nr:hypothetical protein [Bacteroidota bacterium]